jgi:hypothetical protein
LTLILAGCVLYVLIGFLIFRRRLLSGRASEKMCKELVVSLARSEHDRKVVIKGFLESCQEVDRLRAEKRRAWGIPDEM